MATLGLAATHANILINGLASWKVKWGYGETADDAYYSLGALADGRFMAKTIGRNNSYGREVPHGIELEASAKMLCTNKTTVLALLHNLGNAALSHKIAAINGETYVGNWGMWWKFDSSLGYEGNRFVEVKADHKFILDGALTDWGDVLAAAAADGTPDAGDTLYTWSATTCNSAGISAITIDPAGSAETVGNFSDAKLVAELLTIPDHQGRSKGYGVKIGVEFKMMQSDEEIAFLATNFPNIDSIALTLADSTVFTLSSQSGIGWEYANEGDSDGIAHIIVRGGGTVKLTEWAALIS